MEFSHASVVDRALARVVQLELDDGAAAALRGDRVERVRHAAVQRQAVRGALIIEWLGSTREGSLDVSVQGFAMRSGYTRSVVSTVMSNSGPASRAGWI
jgi:hypothetical protein